MDYKEALLNTGLFKPIPSSPYQYRCQCCPFCGDMKWHLYVLIKTVDDTPVVYDCKKCNASGVLNQKFLEYFHLEDDVVLPKKMIRHKKLVTNENVSLDIKEDFVNEYDDISDVCRYIDHRVGVKCDLLDLKAFRYVSKPMNYASEYLSYHGNDKYFRNRFWFKLTNGNIIGRYLNDNTNVRWLRFKSVMNMKGGLYTIRKPVDVYQTVNVCVVEGIMDAIGLYYHGGIDNAVYIACMGSDYIKGVMHVLNMGIFGNSVNIGIYKDSDVDNHNIHIDWRMRKLFNKVNIYQNMLDKDYGVPIERLDITHVGKL